MESSIPQLTSMPAPLEAVRIKGLPDSAFYVSDFITEEEERALLNKVCLIFNKLFRSVLIYED
jgi:hypothetical protein